MGGSHGSVLLVEDNALIAISELRDLERLGYAVEHVLSGEEAVRRATAGGDAAIDVVLMDIDLGAGIDGTEAAQRILGERELPILFLSSHTEPEYLERCDAITSYGFVEKGSKIQAVDMSIRMALRLFEARMERRRTHERLLNEERKYRYLFENLTEEVHLWQVIRDPAGAIASWQLVDANPAALSVWGRTRDEVVGKRTEEIWPDGDPIGTFLPIVNKVFTDRVPYSWEEAFAGTGQTLLMTTVSFEEFFFSVGRDISRFKRVEEQLTRDLGVYETQLRELHHRVKNNIYLVASVLTLQMEKVPPGTDTGPIVDAIARLDSLQALYDQLLLAPDSEQTGIAGYLERLASSVLPLFQDHETVSFSVEGENPAMHARQLFPVGMIFNELFTNSMKYAFGSQDSGRITISVDREHADYQIRYRDNGIGLPHADDPAHSGFGMDMIRLFAAQLGGSVRFSSDNGAVCEIRIPADPA